MSRAAPGTGAVGCGPRERALFFELLARAVDGEALEDGQRGAISAMDDNVLAFLVRALISGRLAPDGRLFLGGDEVALAERVSEILKEDDDTETAVEEAALHDGDGGSPETMTSNDPHH